jgi:two-component system CheB/CheR fusion protein
VIDGLVITFQDVTAHRRALGQATAARKQAEAVVEAVRKPLLILDTAFRVISANQATAELLRTSNEDIVGRSVFELGEGRWDARELRRILEEVIHQDDTNAGLAMEMASEMPPGLILKARRIAVGDELAGAIVLAMEEKASE